jgi:poly-gamma-glutamate capsule biosynthesis protein CapA/YwtB (metallophosphatase superfamily)
VVTSILVAGDWAQIRAFDGIVRQQPEAIYGDLLPVLRGADLRIVNCECALTRSTRSVWKSGAVFKADPEHVKGLTAVPFDVACLANNHVLDFGVPGLRDTLSVLRRHQIRTVGAGLTERDAHAALTITAKGTRVHIVNFSEGEDLTAADAGPGVVGWDIPRVIGLVKRLKKQRGIVIAVGHCGLEYVPYPPPYVVTAFRAIADAGADAVVGHHPHVPQGIEWRNGRPIFYSLGNFVFYQPTDLFHRKTGYCVTLRISRQGITGADLHPYRITDTGLRALNRHEDREFRGTIARISKPFATPRGHERAWDAYLDYYGITGLMTEVTGILDRMTTERQKAAAMFRNRVTTMQHAQLWKDTLSRAIEDNKRKPLPGTEKIVRDWFSRTVDNPSR